MPDLRHRSPRRAARRRADQRHRGACARFRRCQQFDGRAPVGADRAGAVRTGRNPRLHRARLHRRLCRRVRDRDPHRPRRQPAPLRKGLAPDRDARRVRRGGRLLSPDRPRPRENGAGAGDRRLARIRDQGQFRHDDQAAACRAHRAQRPVRGACWRARGSPPTTPRSNTSRAFCVVFNGAGNFDADAILADWGRPYDIVSPGLGIKQHPCCGSTHPAIDAMLALRAEHDIVPEKVARIEFADPSAPPRPHRPARPAIGSRREVQRAILPGARPARRPHRARAFRGRGVPRPGRARADAAHPRRAVPGSDRRRRRAARRRNPHHASTTGARSRKRIGSALGRGPDNPLPAEALHAKFANCAGRALPPAQVERLHQSLSQLDQAPSLRDVVAAIALSPDR